MANIELKRGKPAVALPLYAYVLRATADHGPRGAMAGGASGGEDGGGEDGGGEDGGVGWGCRAGGVGGGHTRGREAHGGWEYTRERRWHERAMAARKIEEARTALRAARGGELSSRL